jgi:hypothetical protein
MKPKLGIPPYATGAAPAAIASKIMPLATLEESRIGTY